MFQSCSWNDWFASSLGFHENQERLILYTFCSSIPSVDELGGLSSGMWNAAEPEFSGIVDSKFKWNNSANGKSRTLRRPRTFTQDNRKKSTGSEMNKSEGMSGKDLKSEGNLLISESDKLGVNLLGRRFCDNLESFPIKKRFSLLMSQSPLYLSSSSDLNHGSHTSLLYNNHASVEYQNSHSCEVELVHDKSSASTKSSSDGVRRQQLVSTVDFLGISILADAASIERECMEVVGQPVRKQTSGETTLLFMSSKSQRDEDLPSSNPELDNIKAKSPMVSSALVEVLARVSGGSKSDECEQGRSVGSMLSSPSNTEIISSYDGRINWDLNSDMDAWKILPDEILVSKLNGTTTLNKACSHDTENINPEPDQCGTIFEDNKFGIVVKDKYASSYYCMSEGVTDRECATSAVAHHEGKHVLSQTQAFQHLQEDCQYKNAQLSVAIAAKERKYEGSGDKSCLDSTDAYRVCVTEVLSDMLIVEDNVSEQEKCEDNGIINVEAHATVPPVFVGNGGVMCTIDARDSCAEYKMIGEALHAENALITSIDSFSDLSARCHPDYDRVGEHNKFMRSGAQKHESLSSDVALGIAATQSPACQIYHDLCGMMVCEANEKTFHAPTNGSKLRSMACKDCLSDETLCCCELNSCADAKQSKCPHLNSQENPDGDQFSCRSACINIHEEMSTTVELDDSKCSIFSDGSLGAEQTATVHICPNHTSSGSEGMLHDINGVPSMVDSLSSRGVCSTLADIHLGSPGQVSFEDCFTSEYHSDASPVDADHGTGIEMVEFLGDNCFQYEDGELRESICADEVEVEYVNYGSNYRETEFVDIEPTSRLHTDLIVGNLEFKQEQLMSTDTDEQRLPFPEGNLQSKHFLKRMPIPDVSNGKVEVGVDMLQVFRENVDSSNFTEVFSRGKKRFLVPDETIDVVDISGKSSQPACSRLKSWGWDKLHGDSVASSLLNSCYASHPSVSREFIRGTSIPSIRRDASSIIKSKFLEASCRKEVSYAMESRKNNHIDLDAESSDRSLGRYRLSSGRGSNHCWVDSPDHHGNVCYGTYGYRTSSSFTHSGSRNAAAVAVAKVESSGFVVTSDGTIVKADGMTRGSHASRSSKSSTQLHSRSRGSPMESTGVFDTSPDRRCNVDLGRDSRYDSGIVSLGGGLRCHGPMDVRRIDSALQYPLSRECTRSTSRSRMRSPRAWASPVRRNGVRINRLSSVRQQSTSPIFNSERRLLKQRSPQRWTVSGNLAGYAPFSRSRSSPKLASRWINYKN